MDKMRIIPAFLAAVLISTFLGVGILYAQTSKLVPSSSSFVSPTPVSEPTSAPTPRPDITQNTQESTGPLESLLSAQKLGSIWPANPLKYAIRSAVDAGVPANTIVLLLLLPVVGAFIAAARHLLGIRGFGIFLPAALSVVFVAIGPILGIILFLVIIFVSSLVRIILRKTKIKLQYLPRMAILLFFMSFGVLLVLFAAPLVKRVDIINISIFPVLLLILLSQEFARIQMGKSAKVAVNLTTETLILSLISYILLILEPLQNFALLNPESLLLITFLFDFLMGKYVGLRFIEFWRFRKLISSS